MRPDPGCYEARYRVSGAAQRGWSTSLTLLPTAIGLLRVNLSVALVLLVPGAITILPIVAASPFAGPRSAPTTRASPSAPTCGMTGHGPDRPDR